MVDLPAVVGIILVLIFIVGIFWLSIKVMCHNEGSVEAMSDEIEAIISEATAGQLESPLSAAKNQQTIVTPGTDKVDEAVGQKAAGTIRERCAADFIPHQYRPRQHRKEIAA